MAKQVIKIWRLILNMLYRNISIINAINVPKSGPVILCGNHAN